MTTDTRTDAELVIAAREGDKEAFGQLVERHLPLTRRVAMSMIANHEIAWELAASWKMDFSREPRR